ncbi:MAG: STAS-like domain-containing protein [Saccharospirillaceae bacterium]|nr:hypothetical protein A3759_15175 [Thalassolituus sp. HI0120]MCH2039892.1 STAS-like domain-containing protein [Saccharospirillaceae bacterium]
MGVNMKINIADDFSPSPFGRHVSDGKFSGEAFRNDVLIEAFSSTQEEIHIYLDGVKRGFGSSFLEESFAGLLRNGIAYSDVKNRLIIHTKDEGYKNEIWSYIEEENERRS